VAVDSANETVYYTDDSEVGAGIVGAISTNGSDHRVLIHIWGSHPRAVVVDPVNG